MLYDVPMLPPGLEPQLRRLVAAFLEENTKVNLSAFRTEEQCWKGNVLDSLAVLELPIFEATRSAPLPSGEGWGVRVLDLGTGGGFPLLPLAIALPHAQLTGIDSVRKKTDAVARIAASLRLTNVRTLTGRAEALGRDPAYREQFDIVTSRAVASLSVLLEYAAPFVRPQGHIVLWKSVAIEREVQDSLLARAELSAHLVHRHMYDLGEGWGKRQLLVFQKTAPLSEKYPREVGMPSKRPLK